MVGQDFIIQNVFAGLIGLSFGSLVTFLSWRVPANILTEGGVEIGLFGRSKCPRCQSTLRWRELIPVFSWVIQRGRCKSCQAKISGRYPLIEICVTIVTIIVAWTMGVSAQSISTLAFVYFLILLTITDLEHYLVPDAFVLPMAALGVAYSLTADVIGVVNYATPIQSLIGFVAGYGVLAIVTTAYSRLRGIDAMGVGDWKLTAAIGAFLGYQSLSYVILIASIALLLFVTLIRILYWRKVISGGFSVKCYPFAPFLSFGSVVYIFLYHSGLLVRMGGA